jgi:circadian clock protein KaiC
MAVSFYNCRINPSFPIIRIGVFMPDVRRLTTGIPGLDEILHGGLIAERLYLVDGNPGAGKTTFALQFLLEGHRRGQKCLYVTLSETRQELEDGAASHGWSLEKINIIELIPDEQ